MNDIAHALAGVPRPHGDNDPYVEGVILSVDPTARRIEVAVDTEDNPVTVPVIGFIDDYADGDAVMLARRPTGYWAMGVMGGARVITAMPARGTVTAISGSTVTVSTSIGSVVAGSVQSAVISAGNDVVLMWDAQGSPWVVGRVGVSATTPAVPGGLTLDRDGSRVAVSWGAVSGAAYYGVRWSLDGGSTWSARNDVPSTSLALSVGQGQTLTVQVRAGNSGGWSNYSPSRSVSRPVPGGGDNTETVTVMITPSASGTFEDRVAAWAEGPYVYQGAGVAGGSYIGWVGYGSRIRDLGALDITHARIRVMRGSVSYPGPSRAELRLRATEEGTRPGGSPVPTGPTLTFPPVARGGQSSVTLSASFREGLRDGDIRGFVTVGSDRSNWAHNWFALDITYRRPA